MGEIALRFSVFRSSLDEKALEHLVIFMIWAFHEVKIHQYALCFSLFGTSSDEKSLENLLIFMTWAFHEVKKHQYAYIVFSVLGSVSDE